MRLQAKEIMPRNQPPAPVGNAQNPGQAKANDPNLVKTPYTDANGFVGTKTFNPATQETQVSATRKDPNSGEVSQMNFITDKSGKTSGTSTTTLPDDSAANKGGQKIVKEAFADGRMTSFSVIQVSAKGDSSTSKTTNLDPNTSVKTSEVTVRANGSTTTTNYSGCELGGTGCKLVSNVDTDPKTGKQTTTTYDKDGKVTGTKVTDIPKDKNAAQAATLKAGQTPNNLVGNNQHDLKVNDKEGLAAPNPHGLTDHKANVTTNSDGTTTTVTKKPDGTSISVTKDKDGNKTSSVTYDDKGNPKRATTYADGGKKDVTVFDAAGKKASFTSFNKDGKKAQSDTFDDKGHVTHSTNFGPDGKKTSSAIYDDKGHATSITHFDPNGRPASVATLDSNGKEISRVQCDAPGKCPQTKLHNLAGNNLEGVHANKLQGFAGQKVQTGAKEQVKADILNQIQNNAGSKGVKENFKADASKQIGSKFGAIPKPQSPSEYSQGVKHQPHNNLTTNLNAKSKSLNWNSSAGSHQTVTHGNSFKGKTNTQNVNTQASGQIHKRNGQ